MYLAYWTILFVLFHRQDAQNSAEDDVSTQNLSEDDLSGQNVPVNDLLLQNLPDDDEECLPDEPSPKLGPGGRTYGRPEKRSSKFISDHNMGRSFYEKYQCFPQARDKVCVKKTFYPSRDAVPFKIAKEKCMSQGMRLVSILNEETWDNLKATLRAKGLRHYWTSAVVNRTSGTFVWDNGCPFGNVTNWAPGEPNNFHNRPEECVEIRPSLEWNDDPCHRAKHYICEENGCWPHGRV